MSRSKSQLAKALRGASLSIVATAEGTHGYYSVTPSSVANAAKEAGLSVDYRENVSPDDTNYPEWIGEMCARKDGDGDPTQAETVDASGILPIADGLRVVYHMGGWGVDPNTMGTLGGPLGGHVPDLAVEVEDATSCAVSIRITPFRNRRALVATLAALVKACGGDLDAAADAIAAA